MICKSCKRTGKNVKTVRYWPDVLKADRWASKIQRLMTALGRREVCPLCGSIFTLKGRTICFVLQLEVRAIEVKDP